MIKSNGFSLLEIAVVMAIVSIIASISMPNFSQWKNKAAVGHTTKILSTILSSGRIDAVTQNRTIHVLISNNKVIYDAPDPVSGFCGVCKEKTEDFRSYSKMISISPSTDIMFFSDGTALPSTIVVSSPDATKSVVVNVVGRVY